MAAKKASDATKTLILDLKNGNTRKITVPSHWRVTFGNVIPYQGNDARQGEARIALRLYEGNKDNLRAVYTDVVSFQDESIATLEKRVSVQRKNHQEEDPGGSVRDVVVEARVTEWVNPHSDAPPQPAMRFKQIGRAPGDEEEGLF